MLSHRGDKGGFTSMLSCRGDKGGFYPFVNP